MSHGVPHPRRLAPVTSLRFFAAGLIVLHHSRGIFGIPAAVGEYFNFAQAVSFFFVMSGFVLAYVYPSLNGRANRAQFFLARITRLWPLHIAMFLLAVALIPWKDLTNGAQSSIGIVLANLFLVQAWIPLWSYMCSFNAPSWYVSTQISLYLLFPIMIWKWDRTWHWKLLLSFLLLVAIFDYCRFLNITAGMTGGISYVGLAHINPLSRLFEFTLGMTAAKAFLSIAAPYKARPVIGTSVEGLTLLAVIGIMIITSFISLQGLNLSPTEIMWVRGGGVSSLFFAIFILVIAMEQGALSNILAKRPFVLLGEMSYAIFMLHTILLRSRTIWLLLARVPESIQYALYWVLLLAVSYILWRFVENPCRAFLMGMAGTKSWKFGTLFAE